MFFLLKLLFFPLWLPLKLLGELTGHSGHRGRGRRRSHLEDDGCGGCLLTGFGLFLLICWPLTIGAHADGAPSLLGWIAFGLWLPTLAVGATLISRAVRARRALGAGPGTVPRQSPVPPAR